MLNIVQGKFNFRSATNVGASVLLSVVVMFSLAHFYYIAARRRGGRFGAAFFCLSIKSPACDGSSRANY